jgi:hypothetical protein
MPPLSHAGTQRIMLILAWFGLALIILLLMLIARLYGRLVGKNTHYLLFLMPLAIICVASVRYAAGDLLWGEPFGAALWAIGGFTLARLSWRLHRTLTQTAPSPVTEKAPSELVRPIAAKPAVKQTEASH